MERKIYEIERIEGEYAYIKDTVSGEELFLAMALLPIGADLGDRVEYDGCEMKLI